MQTEQFSVTSAEPVEIISGLPAGRYQFRVLSLGGSGSVYIGDSNSVTPSTGYPTGANPIDAVMGPGDSVWACSTGTSTVAVLVTPV